MPDTTPEPKITDDQLKAAEALRSASIGWIMSADAKATTIASVLAVVLGLVSIDMAEASHAASLQVVYWVFLGLGAISVVLCVATLWPMTNRRAYVPTSALATSPTYFGDIPDDFAAYAARHASDDDIRRDTFEQAFIVARIARRKMRLVRLTITSFVITMLTLVLVAFLASVGRPMAGPVNDAGPSATGDAATTAPSP